MLAALSYFKSRRELGCGVIMREMRTEPVLGWRPHWVQGRVDPGPQVGGGAK